MAKHTTASYVLELRLKIHQNERAVLEKRFAIAEKIYNQVMKHAQTQLVELRKNRRYQQVLKDRRTAIEASNAKQKNTCNKELRDIQKQFGVTEYALHSHVGRIRKPYTKHIDSFTAQKIATTVWASGSDNLYRDGKRMSFKPQGTLLSMEGKSNATGIRFKGNRVEWNKLVLPVAIRDNDLFVQEALASDRVKYVRIVRKSFPMGWKYFVQLVMEGVPPVKRNNHTGMPRRASSPSASVGIDMGASTVATVSPSKADLRVLFPEANRFDPEIRRLQRKLDRSKRSMNPNNFHGDGTIQRGIRLSWAWSSRYKAVRFQLKSLQRKRSVLLKQTHNQTANHILEQGNTLYVETMNFRALMKRAKETTTNKEGRFHRKKRFGKSIGSHAPALLLDILQMKAEQAGGVLHKVHTYTFKASQ